MEANLAKSIVINNRYAEILPSFGDHLQSEVDAAMQQVILTQRNKVARLLLRLKSSIPLQQSASWKRPSASFSSINGPWKNRSRSVNYSWP
jgi:hypothetical protein